MGKKSRPSTAEAEVVGGEEVTAERELVISEAMLVLSKETVKAGLEDFIRDELNANGVEVRQRFRERLSHGRSTKLARLIVAESHFAFQNSNFLAIGSEDDALESKAQEMETKMNVDVVPLEEKSEKALQIEGKETEQYESKLDDTNTNACIVSEEELAEEEALLCQPQYAVKVERLRNVHVCRGDEHVIALLCQGINAKNIIAQVVDGEVVRDRVTEAGLLMLDVDSFEVAENENTIADAEITTNAQEEAGDKPTKEKLNPSPRKDKVTIKRNKSTDNILPESDEEPQTPPIRLQFMLSRLTRFDNGLRDFFITSPPPLGDAEAFGNSKSRVISRKNVMVSLDQLIQFMFPTNLQHPRSTGRLLLFGEYGPLDEHSKLRCGAQGSHVVRRYELNALGKQIEEEDLLQIFAPGEVLSASKKAEVLREVTKDLSHSKQMTKREVYKLFEDEPRDSDGLVSFHDMEDKIHAFRKQRIFEMKESSSGAGNQRPRTKKDMSCDELQELRKHENAVREAVRDALLPAPKVNESDAYVVVTRLLNRNTHKIATLDDKNHPSLVLNARLVGEDRIIPGMIPWKSVLGGTN